MHNIFGETRPSKQISKVKNLKNPPVIKL
jgi:hypothetical protein